MAEEEPKKEFMARETPPEEVDFKYLCKHAGEFQFLESKPKNRRSNYEIKPHIPCQQHAENTCCMLRDSEKIAYRLSKYGWEEKVDKKGQPKPQKEQIGEPNLSQRCMAVTEEVMCSICDGDIGIHKKKGLCLNMCESWYEACFQDFVVPMAEEDHMPIDLHGSFAENSTRVQWLDFRHKDAEDDEGAVAVGELFPEKEAVVDFCSAMGFPVNFDEPRCYNGVPTAKFLKLNQAKIGWNKHRGVSTVDVGVKESVSMMTRNLRYLGMFIFIGSLVVVFYYAFYEFNLWQIRLDTKRKEAEERQRRIDAVKERRAARRAEKARLEKELEEEKLKFLQSSEGSRGQLSQSMDTPSQSSGTANASLDQKIKTE